MLESAPVEKLFKYLFISRVVGCLFELELSRVCHELSEFLWVSVAELLNGGVDLAFLDFSVFVILVSRAQALPG